MSLSFARPHNVQGVSKMPPCAVFSKMSITNGTLSAKFYTHNVMYSTKVHILFYQLESQIAKLETLVDKNVIILCIL